MRNKYLCTYIDCINLLYPKGYKLNNYKVLNLINDDLDNLSDSEMNLIKIIKENHGCIKLEK
ncbi:hypothetical protein LEQ07_00645 [Paraclostridium sp. AKS73]|nr:hypothetical protein [Paraclostridium sp. AKS73]MCU9813733.1 hypothetical protein [Paraclostridium sp. AKS73]